MSGLDLVSLVERLGLAERGHWLVFPLATLILVCVVVILLRKQCDDELLNLSLLSLVASVCFPHSGEYDLILMIFPLCFLTRIFSELSVNPKMILPMSLCVAFLLAIALPWYFLRAVEMSEVFWGSTTQILSNVTNEVARFAIYGSLALCMWRVASMPSASCPEHAVRSGGDEKIAYRRGGDQ
jgi:hypothetical protein